MASALTYNVTLRPLYKCIRAELFEMGARNLYWHQGPVNPSLCSSFRPLAFAAG